MTELNATEVLTLLDIFGGDRLSDTQSLHALKGHGLIERLSTDSEGLISGHVTPKGYKELRERLESYCGAVTRLRDVLADNAVDSTAEAVTAHASENAA